MVTKKDLFIGVHDLIHIASVEIKTSIATSAVDSLLHNARIDFILCTVGDDKF